MYETLAMVASILTICWVAINFIILVLRWEGADIPSVGGVLSVNPTTTTLETVKKQVCHISCGSKVIYGEEINGKCFYNEHFTDCLISSVTLGLWQRV